MAVEFTEAQRNVLRIVQADLPRTLTPYADIAAQAGVSEGEVLALLSSLKESGAIRRFGASIKHQRAGWSFNAMVAWKVDPESVQSLGEKASESPNVSHCYYRPSKAPDWPYELYTMVHGRSAEEVASAVDSLKSELGLSEYLVLRSLRELKKISPTYF